MITELCLTPITDIYQYSFSPEYPFILFPSIHLHYSHKDVIITPKNLYLLYSKYKKSSNSFIFNVRYIGTPIYSKLLYNTNYSSIYNIYIKEIQDILPFYKDITNIIIQYLPKCPIWKLYKKKTNISNIQNSIYNIIVYEIPIQKFTTSIIPKYYRKSLYGVFRKKSYIPIEVSNNPLDITKYHTNDTLVMIFFTNISFYNNSSSSSDDESELEYI